jgi:hypothetical protein
MLQFLRLFTVFVRLRMRLSLGARIASLPVMADDHYFSLLLWTIYVLMFACSVVALTQHPEWFGA